MRSMTSRKILLASLFALFTLFSLISHAVAQTCVQPPSGLVSWWPGDGNANDIVGGNHGTLQNGATFAPGKVDQAFSFDGVDDFISFGTGPSITGTGPFTVDAWVKTTDSEGVIIQQRDGGFNGEYMLGIGTAIDQLDPGKACWATFGDGEFGFKFCSNRAVNDGVFHHIAATREADGTGRIYIDGVLDASQSAPRRTLVPLGVFIGADKRDEIRFLNGIIDEVEIHNRALSASEIQAIFAAGSAGKCKEEEPPETVSSKQTGKSTKVGDPISASSGEFYFNMPLFDLGGPLSLRYTIFYRVQQTVSGAFGSRFDHNIPRLTLSGSEALILAFDEDDNQLSFSQDASGNWQVETGVSIQYVLKETTNAFYLMDPVAERVYVFEKATGGIRLRFVMDRNGNLLAYTYADTTTLPQSIIVGVQYIVNSFSRYDN